ncbi:MAG: extracellular solute-binding protein [Chloroflexi bacterium]|nr:extracellular solute-binding protein [Chloroflexota bacterium]
MAGQVHKAIFTTVCLLAAVMALIAAAGCSAPGPAPAAGEPKAGATTAPKPSADDWRQTWDKLLAAAKKEGKVVIYSSAPTEARNGLSNAFRGKYGIDLEFTPGRNVELNAKIERENRAGLHLVDVGLIGWASYSRAIAELTDPIEPLLVLPDVRDTGRWFGTKLPLMDKDGHAFALVMMAGQFHIINTDLVKKGEVTSTRDFVNPKWKKKIVMMDPTIPGPAVSWYQSVVSYAMGMEKGRAYMKDLAQNVDTLTRDYRQHADWVARGKYPLGVAIRGDEPTEFIKLGAPIEFVVSDEPRIVTPAWALLNVFKQGPNPNAARVFVNWLLTQEGLSEIAGISLPVTRTDVSTGGIPPAMLRRPNDVVSTQEQMGEQPRMIEMAKEDFASLFK